MQLTETFPQKYPLTITHFQKMIATGILEEDERIELIEGELIAMVPIGPEHSGKTRRLIRILSQVLGEFAILDVQNPIILGLHSEPQPDIVLLRPRADFYEHATPQPEDVLLVVEVSDSTLKYDKNLKIPLYARHGIPEVWLINLPEKRVEIYLKPGPAGYQQVLQPKNDEIISPSLLPEIVIEIAKLWN